ncbi:hypothetical protein ACUSIJ_03620 [Pseudochelatococcus sp. B33]
MDRAVENTEARAEIGRFLQAVRRRETAGRLIVALSIGAIAGLLTAALVVFNARIHLLPVAVTDNDAAWWGMAAGLSVAACLAAGALRQRPSLIRVARRIERRLQVLQALSTALDIGSAPAPDGPVAQALLEDARTIARSTPLRKAAPLATRALRLSLVAMLIAGASLWGAQLLPSGATDRPRAAASGDEAAAENAVAAEQPPKPADAVDAAAQQSPRTLPQRDNTALSPRGLPDSSPQRDAARVRADMSERLPDEFAGPFEALAAASRHGEEPDDISGLPAGRTGSSAMRPDDAGIFGDDAVHDSIRRADAAQQRAARGMAQTSTPRSSPDARLSPDAAAQGGDATPPWAMRRSDPRAAAAMTMSGRGDAERRDSAFSATGTAAPSAPGNALPEEAASGQQLEVYTTTPNEGRRVRLYVEPQAERDARRARQMEANADTGRVWAPVAVAPVVRQAIAADRAGIVTRYFSAPGTSPDDRPGQGRSGQ